MLDPLRFSRWQGALILPLLGACVILSGCASSRHELLHATLWVQRAAEFEASSLQAYTVAEAMLERALADTSWSAETTQTAGCGALPPAVILDIDETVLDNSPYQARLIRDTASYDSTSWNPWCREAVAEAVPGAVEFCRRAADAGVAVYYLTNRRENLRDATRRNLVARGFPMEPHGSVIARGKEDPGDKLSRRQAIARGHRILLLVGDNLGDFISQDKLSTEARSELTARYAEWWGTRWIVISNPMYGDWEAAILGHEQKLSDGEKLRHKRAALSY